MEYPGTHQPHPYNEIHLPDSVTGFCYKCGKYAKEYGKYCNEIKRERKGRKMIVSEKKRKILDSKDVVKIFKAVLDSESEIDRNKEHFWVCGLNNRNVIVYIELVSLGVLNQSLVHPREVFRLAITKGVGSIICCHNHPSATEIETIQISTDDTNITERLVAAGKLLGIQVLDHIVIGNDTEDYYSFIKEGKI